MKVAVLGASGKGGSQITRELVSRGHQVVAIARNHAIDRIRARRQPSAGMDAALDVADPAPGPEAAALAGDEGERVHRCLEELEQDRAAAVRGAYLGGESYAELAERHGVPLNTMRTWLRRSLIKLRECLTA